MKDIEIKITKSTRFVDFKTEVIGNDGESLQSKLIFTFKDEFVDGQARLEYEINCEKYYAPLEKIGESYEIPVKSVMTKQGLINMQLVITQGTNENEIPIFKSNKFFLTCNESINAEIEQPEEYEEWIDVANTKLNQVDNVDIDITTIDEVTKVEITRKDGTKKEATVNGSVNAITDVLVDGKTVVIDNVANIDLSSKQDELISGQNIKTINNQSILGEGNIVIESSEEGTYDYEELTNKPKINNVELKGNKTLEELGIQPKGNYLTNENDPTVPNHVKNITQENINDWNNKSNFSGNYNDLSNKPTIPSVPTKISAFENDEGYLKEHQDLTEYAKKTDYYNKTEINSMIGDIESMLKEV